MATRTNDNEWKPTPKQSLFLSIPNSIKEAFYAGALGAGKTDVLLVCPILNKWHEDRDFKGIFLRRTFPELKNEVIPRSKKLFPLVGGKYNTTDKIWDFSRASGLNRSKSPQGAGALFFFAHCENEDDVHMYDSMQPNYAAFDELTSFTEWQYLYIVLERVRKKKYSNLPMISRSASNPGNTGHNWVRKRFIDPHPEGGVRLRGPSGIQRIFIPANIYDNPHIDPEYIKSLEALPEAEKQAKLYGRWDAYEGSVFEEFRDKHYPDEPDNALHVIDSFDIPDWWPRIVVGDWGYAAMTWIGHAAISPERRVILYREQTFGDGKSKRVKIEEWAPYVKQYIDKEHPRVVKFCKSAGQDRGQELTIQQQLSNALGVPIELTSNSPGSRVAGKALLHEYLRWRPKHIPEVDVGTYDDEYAMWILRNRPPREYKAYIATFNESEPEKNLPKLLIFKDCNEEKDKPEVVNAIKACVYDKVKVEDVAEFNGDDPYDGIRYLIDSVERYFDEAKEEFTKVQKQEELVQTLEKNSDWTAFYREMRKTESGENAIRPVSRYHHGAR
jgi:hypothetical protein